MRTKKFKIDLISETEARCRLCKEIKPINQFRANLGQWDCKNFRLSFCNTCKNEKRRERGRTNPLSMIRIKIQSAKQRAKKKNIPYNLTAEYVYDLYKKQEGKCYYTNEPMFLAQDGKKRAMSLSIDRVNIEKGYTQKNIVLCTDRINSIKNNLTLTEIKDLMPKIYQKIKEGGFI